MAEDKKAAPAAVKSEEKATEGEKEKETTVPSVPPLEAGARRLERLLGGGLSDKDRQLHTYANPAKVVRRWLGTASGGAGKATAEDISAAAAALLDPAGISAKGRELLATATTDSSAMDVDTGSSSTKTGFLTNASSREVESWLISLSVRLLWKEKQYSDAFELAQKGVSIVSGHLDTASANLSSKSGLSASSLFPLLARMYRLRSLAAESLANPETSAVLRQDLVKAHNLASLRRDVDCQATLLNLMLRDLLQHSQGKLDNIYCILPTAKGTKICAYTTVN